MLFRLPHFASLSLVPSLSHFLFITVTLSVSSFPPFSSHTIPLLLFTHVRSYTGSPFSDEFDKDQIAKADTVAYGIWKLIHLMFIYKVVTWHSVHVSLIWYSFHSFSFFFINCFIASLFLFWCLSHTLFLDTSLRPLLSLSIYLYLYLTFTLRIALILLLVLHISLSHLFSVSLAQPLTIIHFMFATLFLSFLHSCWVINLSTSLSLPPSLFIFLTESKFFLSSCRSLFFSLTHSLCRHLFYSHW